LRKKKTPQQPDGFTVVAPFLQLLFFGQPLKDSRTKQRGFHVIYISSELKQPDQRAMKTPLCG
jgi:hypothetical protein